MLFGRKILPAVLKVTNGQFTTNTTGWTATANTTLSVESGGKTGNYMKVLNGSDEDLAHGYQALSLTPGKRYRLTLWHKGETGGSGAGRVTLQDKAPGSSSITVWYNSGSLSASDWTVLSTTFVAEKNTVYLCLSTAAGNGKYHGYDSVEVFEIMKADANGCYQKVRGRDFHFFYKPTTGFDRTVKVYGSINDVDYFDLGLSFSNQHATYSSPLASLYCDYEEGEVGSADFWIMGRSG